MASIPFHEVRFPEKYSLQAVGGPGFKTTILTRASGFEDRNIEWRRSRHEFDVSHVIKTQLEFDELVAFFNNRMGRGYGFRFKYWADWKSCSVVTPNTSITDQVIGKGDGRNKIFQLVKRYTDGLGMSYVRQVRKPVANTTIVGVNGVKVNTPADYTVDITTGRVLFTIAPAANLSVTAGFEFDIPVRFDTDKLAARIENWNIFTWGDISLTEIRV